MVFLFIFIIAVLIIFSKFRIEIINFNFSSEKIENRHINKDYKIIFKLYILKYLPIIKINITKTKLEKIKLKDKMKNLDMKLIENKNKFDKEFFKTIKDIKYTIKNINLRIDLGTENASLTSFIIPIISTIISIYLQRKIEKFKNQRFIVNPIYKDKNFININLNCIFEIKMIHIINIIYILNKKRRDENVRTSNRRSYDYSYE